jgi:hypothetical protein
MVHRENIGSAGLEIRLLVLLTGFVVDVVV